MDLGIEHVQVKIKVIELDEINQKNMFLKEIRNKPRMKAWIKTMRRVDRRRKV